jgi:hypothetical protein
MTFEPRSRFARTALQSESACAAFLARLGEFFSHRRAITPWARNWFSDVAVHDARNGDRGLHTRASDGAREASTARACANTNASGSEPAIMSDSVIGREP